MKKIITLSLLIISIICNGIAQTVPNSGFENWVTQGSYTNPESWDTPNSVTTAIPIIGSAVVTKSTGGHTGSWCAKLENKNFIVYTVPGIMTLGVFNIDLANQNFSLTGGVPFSQRPDLFKGYYKYSPQGGDSCAFIALFYKHNTSGGTDTIGMAVYLDNSSTTSWTSFEAPVTWFTNDTPDTMNILVSSAASFSPNAGSVLYVDDLSFEVSSGVAEHKTIEPVTVQYNRLSRNISVGVNLPGENKVVARVVTLTGQTIRNAEASVDGQKTLTLGMENQARGLYIVDVQAGDKHLVKKIVVN